MNQPLHKDYFSGVAEGYSQYRPRYPHALFEYLSTLVDKHDIAWDCATGNGQAAVMLAQYFQKVIATDSSQEQLNNTEQHRLVEYLNVPAENSGIENNSVNIITVAQALHWFDLPAFYAEAKRVIKRGGILAVWTYGKMKLDDPELRSVLGHYYHDVVGPYWPTERKLVEEKYESIDFPFDEITPPDFNIESAMVLDELIGYVRTWSATQKFIASEKTDPVLGLEKDLINVWEEPDFPLTFRWPLNLRIGRI